jgi:hypothetical protein
VTDQQLVSNDLPPDVLTKLLCCLERQELGEWRIAGILGFPAKEFASSLVTECHDWLDFSSSPSWQIADRKRNQREGNDGYRASERIGSLDTEEQGCE